MSVVLTLPKLAVRARARPRAVALLFCWEMLLALSVGGSFAAVARAAYGNGPAGDAPLFAPGGLALLDLLRHSRAALGPLLHETVAAAVIAHFGGAIVYATAYADLSLSTTEGRTLSFRTAIDRALEAGKATYAILIGTLVVEGLVLTLGLFSATILASGASVHFDERGSDLVTGAIYLLALAPVVLVGIVGDLARGAAVVRRGGAWTSTVTALAAFAASPMWLTWSYAWRVGSALLPVIVGATLASRIGGRGGVALVALALVHQSIVLARVAIRTSWMARALRAIS